jgi:hypothetical protein
MRSLDNEAFSGDSPRAGEAAVLRGRNGEGRSNALHWCGAGERAMNALDVAMLSEQSPWHQDRHGLARCHWRAEGACS